jgi:hypothetical protein
MPTVRAPPAGVFEGVKVTRSSPVLGRDYTSTEHVKEGLLQADPFMSKFEMETT